MKKSVIELKGARELPKGQLIPADWLTREQIALKYHISVRTADYYWVESGRLPHHRPGRLVRFGPLTATLLFVHSAFRPGFAGTKPKQPDIHMLSIFQALAAAFTAGLSRANCCWASVLYALYLATVMLTRVARAKYKAAGMEGSAPGTRSLYADFCPSSVLTAPAGDSYQRSQHAEFFRSFTDAFVPVATPSSTNSRQTRFSQYGDRRWSPYQHNTVRKKNEALYTHRARPVLLRGAPQLAPAPR